MGPCLSFPACASAAHPGPGSPQDGAGMEGFSPQQTASGVSHRARARPRAPLHPQGPANPCPSTSVPAATAALGKRDRSRQNSAPTWGAHPEHPLPETP